MHQRCLDRVRGHIHPLAAAKKMETQFPNSDDNTVGLRKSMATGGPGIAKFAWSLQDVAANL